MIINKKIFFFLGFYLLFVMNIAHSQWVEQSLPSTHILTCTATFASVYLNSSGWIGGDSGTVYFTSNLGSNWNYRPCTQAGIYRINTIEAIGPQTAICSYSTPFTTYIYRTINGGLNWQQVYQQDGGNISSIQMIQNNGFQEATTGYAIGRPVGGRWTILKTTNGGVSFDSAGMYLSQNGFEVPVFNNSFCLYNNSNTYLMFGTNTGRVYRSSNGGANWNFSNLPVILSVYCLTYFISGSQNLGGLAADLWLSAKSTDQGATWQSDTLPGPGGIHVFNHDVTSSPRYGKDFEIFVSTNSGQSFVMEYSAPDFGYYIDMSVRTSVFEGGMTLGWAIKNTGAVSRYYNIFSGVKNINSEIPEKFSLFQNFPNPFNPATNIKFSVPQKAFVTITIYNVLGEEITKLVSEEFSPGTYETNWDAANYPSGVYYYQLTVNTPHPDKSGHPSQEGNYVETKKMVLIK